SRDPVDVQRAGGRSSSRGRRRFFLPAEECSGRFAWRGLLDRERPLSIQKSLRRFELEPAAPLAVDRAGRQCKSRRVPACGSRQDLRPPANIYSLFENTSGKISE